MDDRRERGDGLDLALQEIDPVRDVNLSSMGVRQALEALGGILPDVAARQDSTAIVARRRRRRRTMYVGGAIAALLAAGTPAAAGWIDLHTGVYGSPGATENDTSEWLDTRSPQLPAFVEGLGQSYPLPPGYDLHYVSESLAQNPGWIQVTGVESAIASIAACDWMDEWLHAHEIKDNAAQAIATGVLVQAAGWEIWLRIDGGGIVDSYRKIAHAAQEGNPTPLQKGLDVNCPSHAHRVANGTDR